MSDSNAYINAYVDNSVGMLHEYVSMVLQLKTQLKVTSDMIAGKDATISSLQREIDDFRSTIGSNNEQINQAAENARKWEHEYNEMKVKSSHVDSLTNQINEMKRMILEKDVEIKKLNEKITKLSSPKKVINTSKIKHDDSTIISKEPESTSDDF